MVLEEEQTLNSALANNGIWSRLRRSITWWGIMEIVKSVKHLKWADQYLDEDAHPWTKACKLFLINASNTLTK